MSGQCTLCCACCGDENENGSSQYGGMPIAATQDLTGSGGLGEWDREWNSRATALPAASQPALREARDGM